jgi:hypothetical protein
VSDFLNPSHGGAASIFAVWKTIPVGDRGKGDEHIISFGLEFGIAFKTGVKTL